MSDLREGAHISKSTPDSPIKMNRYMGGRTRKTQPYVSGYWYFMLLTPDVIFSDDGGADLNAGSDTAAGNYTSEQQYVEKWFHSAAESFTPPSTTLTKLDIPGMGGLGSSFITGREITRTFTVAFREYTNLPIMSALTRWTSIMDPYIGISAVKAEKWNPSTYKGAAVAFLCKPTMSDTDRQALSYDSKSIITSDIEQLYFFDGVWPESAPHDSFNSDIATNDGVQLSVTFNFDGWVYTKEKYTNDKASFGSTIASLLEKKGFTFVNIAEYINNDVLMDA